MTEVFRSKVNPPTLHSPGVGVDGLNVHDDAIFTLVPGAIEEKSPVDCRTNELFQFVTFVAVASELLSNVTEPPKSIVPWMGMGAAWAVTAARAIKADAIRYFAGEKACFINTSFLILRISP